MNTDTLKVLQYPHKILRSAALMVTTFDNNLSLLIKQMFATMYQAQGVGLAANQVGILLRLFVMDTSEARNQPLCLINPLITEREGLVEAEEGCLSFPGIYIKVNRATTVKVEYQDEQGHPQQLTAQGLAAQCVQHELDHLAGKTFIDHLSVLKRMRLIKKLQKKPS